MSQNLKKAALISVFDKTGVIEFAKSLSDLGYIILSSSGTAKHLSENGVEVELVEEYTAQKEILGGRVKTLHPKIHGGILAKREAEHLADLASIDGYSIDVVAVNLYPFIQNLKTDAAKDPLKMVELIDIGGPTMIRSAAKNHKYVYSVIDPEDYEAVIENIKIDNQQAGLDLRAKLAVKVFTNVASYNLAIANYFSGLGTESFSETEGVVLAQEQQLRYGENPHQLATFYTDYNQSQLPWQQLAGKDLSYNNLLDLDAAVNCLLGITSGNQIAVIMKHLNPCGVAIASSQVEAVRLAKTSDPRSHFGGIIAVNKILELTTAENLVKDFCEIVIAPEFSEGALDLFSKKKNVRLIKYDYSQQSPSELRSCAGGYLKQQSDLKVSSIDQAELKTKREASQQELADLALAWEVCRSVKSNAITLVREGLLLAAGAGQMSRIDSVELAIKKAKQHGHTLENAVAASDAFFPFSDNVEVLAEAGIKSVIVTGGSRQDAEVIAKALELGISLYFTNDRHFKH